jgi:hypothetical protein
VERRNDITVVTGPGLGLAWALPAVWCSLSLSLCWAYSQEGPKGALVSSSGFLEVKIQVKFRLFLSLEIRNRREIAVALQDSVLLDLAVKV